ncbi:MAG: hypothetical protein ABIF85_05380 [Nanoarchaeota archaeon]|nr:hypothetical protein [Nanoarchaeota archaeon]MBU4300723.1 hypothetical protein [Nanoarchaeota archaeon]MBU4452409.1 hypothetical protein [Nanoarchaeota archaeon]MCG2723315.1 hypothetical protein [archaeon]
MKIISTRKQTPFKLNLCRTDYLKIKSATGIDPNKLILISEEELKQLETLDLKNTINASEKDIVEGRVCKWDSVKKELGL